MELYYYTSTDTMRYVLTKGNIYATNIRYMNDSEEYVNGLQELYELAQKHDIMSNWFKQRRLEDWPVDSIKNIFNERNLKSNRKEMEYYTISFCKKNDLLSQWAIYAKESGVSIKMNFSENSYCFETNSRNNNEKVRWNLLPQEVYYFTCKSMNPKEYEDVAFKILEHLYPQNAIDLEEGKKEQWRYVATLVKRYDFYQEQECRLVFEPSAVVFPPDIQYRLDKKVLKPYLDIECENGWPIWEVMIGPGFNQQVVYDSVVHFLNHTKTKVGIENTNDYIARVKKYLGSSALTLETCDKYKQLNEKMSDSDWIRTTLLEDAKIIVLQKLHEIISIIDENDAYENDIKNYFRNNNFTRSGVVVTKSSIPYIF